MTGPLSGVTVVELVGQGPAPYACMLLADMGAEVVGVDRVGAKPHPRDAHARGRRYVGMNLKDARGRDLLLDLIGRADVLVEGYRPGVAERLGLGPDDCIARNPGLVYARMTGWGQDGPLAQSAGHDITYLAVSGALHAIGEAGRGPVPPINLVADYGAGGPLLAFGVVAALLERATSGRGQVVDAAMVDGVGLMMAPFHAMAARGTLGERGTNLLDGGAHFYRTYRTADDRWLAVGAIERPFYLAFLGVLGIDEDELGPQMDKAGWPGATERIAAIVATRTRDEWVAAFEGHDACVAPVLSPAEAQGSAHARARATFVDVDGLPQPAPAPRFTRTPADRPLPISEPGADTDAVLGELGLHADELGKLRAAGVIG